MKYNRLEQIVREEFRGLRENSLNENQDAYTLHRLANNVGQSVAEEFLMNHNVDLKLLAKAIQQNTISKYEVRDVINNTAHKLKIKQFMDEFVKESVNEGNDPLELPNSRIVSIQDDIITTRAGEKYKILTTKPNLKKIDLYVDMDFVKRSGDPKNGYIQKIDPNDSYGMSTKGLKKVVPIDESFKKGDRVKFVGEKSLFKKLDPNRTYTVDDVVPHKDGGERYIVDQNPMSAEDLQLAESVNEGYHTFKGKMKRDLTLGGKMGSKFDMPKKSDMPKVTFKIGEKVELEIQPNSYHIYGKDGKHGYMDKQLAPQLRFNDIDDYVIYESVNEAAAPKFTAKDFVEYVNDEFDSETLQLMANVLAERLKFLDKMKDMANPRTVVQGYMQKADLKENLGRYDVKLEEGAFSELQILADESGNFEEFFAKVKQEFPDASDDKTKEMLRSMYDDESFNMMQEIVNESIGIEVQSVILEIAETFGYKGDKHKSATVLGMLDKILPNIPTKEKKSFLREVTKVQQIYGVDEIIL